MLTMGGRQSQAVTLRKAGEIVRSVRNYLERLGTPTAAGSPQFQVLFIEGFGFAVLSAEPAQPDATVITDEHSVFEDARLVGAPAPVGKAGRADRARILFDQVISRLEGRHSSTSLFRHLHYTVPSYRVLLENSACEYRKGNSPPGSKPGRE